MESHVSRDHRTCVHCGKDVPDDARMCLFCGGEVPRAAVFRVPHCPRCSVPLEHHEFRGEALDLCPRCHGVWCDSEEFRRLTSERDCYRDDSIPKDFLRPPIPEDPSYVPCPRCGEMMARQNFKSLSNVLVDWCRDHGVWLDAGEMEKIRCFIANGGLEQAQDMEIRRNRGDLESLATEFRDADFTRRVLQQKGLKAWIFG